MEDCIFCKIARAEVPAAIVLENEYVVAFDDISPQAPVHTLIIPRSHHTDFADCVSQEMMAALFAAVPAVAEAKGVAESGYRVIVNIGHDGGQTVPHLHLHVLGGKHMSHGMVAFCS